MAVKRFSIKSPKVLLSIMVPFVFFLNVIIFGTCIFESVGLFVRSFLFTGFYIFASNFLFDMVARIVLKKYPRAIDMFKRIVHLLPAFYLLNCLVIPGLFYLYQNMNIVDCPARPKMIFWAIVYGCCCSTMVTFFNLGVANWKAWKDSITETEKLRNIYQRSKILGLKGQINPHFLFNCFNTLSGLIQEDETKAEKFLDEMTKVHRYLLRSDDELLVALEEEIKFAESYLYLAKERFGGAIRSTFLIDPVMLQKTIPPLSMQVILENIIYTNALSKNDPVAIRITSNDQARLSVVNSVHKKTVLQNLNIDDGLDNLMNKYKMLKGGKILITETANSRTLLLPLFNRKEELI
jgi:two-component system, LytTR family, sensor kinase